MDRLEYKSVTCRKPRQVQLCNKRVCSEYMSAACGVLKAMDRSFFPLESCTSTYLACQVQSTTSCSGSTFQVLMI
ncbi:hypothetical protein Mp_6g15410 [Marchantia polymorpha subsp. ruderalis]|uniref:Uncharacterized protein n=2 Tax=Marchantia polymorpha TaxID=3197 RepID=A0AAF6BSB4_MARPO|nr:hypothetical protein MARPO_0056s0053 [Marchantia polymorpha]BBN14898.1 hypothetical protein Mp_6g15410 [Marchantia polymorpha subsp. ruderalis]|eukprot:PTQ37581.1 hypothetical protein MARPO_0056s0053 [Marchantia polymorpha]